MVSCASCGCSQTKNQINAGVTFHRFPKDAKKGTAWIQFVNKLNFIPKSSSVLCSYHFTEECFDRTSKLKVRLHPDATPTIEVDRLKYVKLFNPIVTRHSETEGSTQDQHVSFSLAGIPEQSKSTTAISEPLCTTRLSVKEQTSTPHTVLPSEELVETSCEVQLKQRIRELERSNNLKSRRIHNLQKMNWLQRRKITSLKCLIADLKKQKKP